ncbi:endonuclease domain-containing protein [Nonomuraea sp. NBC_01738]|uniref:endonuclease domain-containing protein n=1 Tax=Nonomuraea sp. NBC_01738 TaxID=2976003 RepID=UPI002E10DE6B|nr:endonuclease domain-containing protein [Nonomuraea sp. NBC_01738]
MTEWASDTAGSLVGWPGPLVGSGARRAGSAAGSVAGWAGVPVGRVVRIAGVSAGELSLALDPLPDGAPAVLVYAAPEAGSAVSFVEDVLRELERVAVELFPAWLPEAEGFTAGGAGVRAVREAARRRAATGAHFGPFLAALAQAALTDDPVPGLSAEVRAAGLARVLADGYGRSRTALLVRVPDSLSAHGQHVLVAGCEWLAHRGGLGVWLLGPLPDVDRVETVAISPGGFAEEEAPGDFAHEETHGGFAVREDPGGFAVREGDARGRAGYPAIAYPAIAGRPHPGSASEQALERALATRKWAEGRAWNQTYQAYPLEPAIRVDLLWEPERCVVEIDGIDHREPVKFEDDRRRDVRLQIAGYAVLRFTDGQVSSDTDAVARQIERFLATRRAKG